MCLYSAQYGLFGVPESLQCLLHLLCDHGEWSFGMGRQVSCPQLWYCGTQTFGVLLCQNGGDAQNTTGLGGESMQI